MRCTREQSGRLSRCELDARVGIETTCRVPSGQRAHGWAPRTAQRACARLLAIKVGCLAELAKLVGRDVAGQDARGRDCSCGGRVRAPHRTRMSARAGRRGRAWRTLASRARARAPSARFSVGAGDAFLSVISGSPGEGPTADEPDGFDALDERCELGGTPARPLATGTTSGRAPMGGACSSDTRALASRGTLAPQPIPLEGLSTSAGARGGSDSLAKHCEERLILRHQ